MSNLKKILLLLLLIGTIIIVSALLFSHLQQKKAKAIDTVQKLPEIEKTKAPEPTEKPFPLHDEKARYHIEENTLFYVTEGQIRPIGIYISKDTKISLKGYEGKDLKIEGIFVQEEKQVQCIKAPCDPMSMTVVHIDSITVVN